MKNVNISNTLWNDTSGGTLAYASQIKDDKTSLEDYSFIPEESKQDNSQSNINKILLDVCENYAHGIIPFTIRFSDEYPGLLELIFND